MNQNSLRIIEAHEQPFFSTVESGLAQWVAVTISSEDAEPTAALVTISAAGVSIETVLTLEVGVREYRTYAPTLWPEHAPTQAARLQLAVGSTVLEARIAVGGHRPWTIYLLADSCTDATWVYHSLQPMKEDDAAITLAELDVADAYATGSEANRNHYNLVQHREVDYFLEIYPEQEQRLIEHVKQGTIELNPFSTMCSTLNVTLEELIRHFYPARRWAAKHGLPMRTANHQETPTIAWATASILAQSGIRYLAKAILPYECPWAARLEEPPIFYWEAPDGNRVLLRRRNTDYVEGHFVLRDMRSTNTALHDRILPEYSALGTCYPFDAIALLGCYGDLAPNLRTFGSKKAATIAAYNNQGWEYPRLVNASHTQFWEDIEAQIGARNLQVPVYRGDYGAAWDAWPASLAYDLAGWRRAQERAGTADTIAAIAQTIDPTHAAQRQTWLAEGWHNLITLSDHAWNGANDGNRVFNAALRRTWQETANSTFDRVIDSGLAALAHQITTTELSLVVFNRLGWQRGGLVELDGTTDTHVIDSTTGTLALVQYSADHRVWLYASDVPAVGYRVYTIHHNDQLLPASANPWSMDGTILDGPHYRLEVSPITGGIVSLYDKSEQREIVKRDAPYHLNQCVYLSDGVEYTAQSAQIELGEAGPLFATLHVHAELKHIQLHTTITLYSQTKQVDFQNDVHKRPSEERQELDFAFPLHVPDGRYRFETPGAIITAGEDQRPGAGMAINAVRTFADLSNQQYGVTLALRDSHLVMFGHRTTLEDPQAPDTDSATIMALAFENVIDWHENLHDQAKVTDFTFRYGLMPHAGYDPVAAVHFGWGYVNELLCATLPAGQHGKLAHNSNSFVQITPANTILSGLKTAEDAGLIARIWECTGTATQTQIYLHELGTLQGAMRTDPLEYDDQALTTRDASVIVDVVAHGIATVRLLTSA